MNEVQWSSELITPKSIAGTALIGKACDILELVGNAPGRIDQNVLAEKTGIPRATLYRIIAALVSRGLIRPDPISQSYTLGFNFLELAQNAWSSSDLASIASVELRRLRDLTGETSYLAVQEGRHVLALGRFESAHDKRSNAKLGALKPMHCTSQGKAILSRLEGAQFDNVVDGELVAFTENTITDSGLLRAHLAIVRARGYAIDDEEIVTGTRCVGAPILDPDGKPIAAISVAGPTFRMHPERAEQLGKELAEVAKRISSQLAPTLKASLRKSNDYCVWTSAPAFIGASPRWDVRLKTVLWADKLAPSIRDGGDPVDFVSLHALSESVSTFCLTEDGFVCGVGSDLVFGDKVSLKQRVVGQRGLEIKSLRASPEGRLWAAAFDSESGVSKIGPWKRDAGLEPVFELSGEVSDIVFAGDGTLMAAQPLRQAIFMLETESGRKRKFADIPKVAGAPQALAIDANYNLWVGLSEGWSVIKLDETGEIVRTIALPIASPTGLAFGGEDLSQIFVTSARSGLSRESLANAPLSGELISVAAGERGLPEIPVRF